MKPKFLLSCALLAFFVALGVLCAGWQGTSSISAAWPVSGSAVQLSGSVKGWQAIGGLLGFLAAIVLFLWALVSLAGRSGRKRQKEPLTGAYTGPEAKGHAASQ